MFYKIYFKNVFAPEFFEFNGNKKDLQKYAQGLFNAQADQIECISKEPKKHEHIHADSDDTLSYEQDWRTVFPKWNEMQSA